MLAITPKMLRYAIPPILPIIAHPINVCSGTNTFTYLYYLLLPKIASPNKMKDMRSISISSCERTDGFTAKKTFESF